MTLAEIINSDLEVEVALDLNTGPKKDIEDIIPNSLSHLTLVFKNNTFPLWHECATIHFFGGCEHRPLTTIGSF